MSFSVYLLHLLVVIPAIAMLLTHTDLSAKSDFVRFAVVCAVCLPVTYALASLLYKFVEKPGVLIGKRVLAPVVVSKSMG